MVPVWLFFFAFSACLFVRLPPIPADVSAHLQLVIQSPAGVDKPVSSVRALRVCYAPVSGSSSFALFSGSVAHLDLDLDLDLEFIAVLSLSVHA